MRVVAVAVLAAVAALPSPVRAAPPGELDFLCGMTPLAYDVERAGMDETEVVEIDGGPVLADGTLTCTVQVGSYGLSGGLHSDGDAASVSGSGSDGVTVVRPALVAYPRPSRAVVWLCDAFTDAAGTAYVFDDWDGAWETAAGNEDARCRRAFDTNPDPGGPPVIAGIDPDPCDATACPPEVEETRSTVDAVICPDLGDEEDAWDDGDVYVFIVRVWDCPPEDDRDLF